MELLVPEMQSKGTYWEWSFLTIGVRLVRAEILGWQMGGSVEWMMLEYRKGAAPCEGSGKLLHYLDLGRFSIQV